jgi:hypothetical protein
VKSGKYPGPITIKLSDKTRGAVMYYRRLDSHHSLRALYGPDQILQSSTDEEFEKEIQDLLSELKTSHTGFRHSKTAKIPGRHAIAATFMRYKLDGECFRTFMRTAERTLQVRVQATFFFKSEIRN